MLWSASATAASIETYDYRGTVGSYPVGAELQVQDGKTILAAHYFYISHLKNIPLTGSISDTQVRLEEPGGGVFDLHFVGNGSQGQNPLNFDNSVSLDGTWSSGGKALPVSFGIDSAFDGQPPQPRYRDVTKEPDATFEAQVQSFIKNVLNDKRETAALFVSYPLRVNGKSGMVIKSRAVFLAHRNDIFTQPLKAELQDAVPHEMSVQNGLAMIGNGAVWFDGAGAAAINEP